MKKLLISNKHNYIYFEIPKAASRTILTALNKTDYKYIDWSEYKDEWNKYFKFTFVRNPIDRIVSCYNYFFYNTGKGNIEYLKQYGLIPGLTFNEFIKSIYNSEEYNKHWELQSELIPYNQCDITYGKVENFNSDFKIIAKKIGIKDIKIKIRNQSVKFFKKSMIDSKAMDMIREIYKKDFELFNY